MMATSVPRKRCSPRSPWYQATTSTIGSPMTSTSTAICRTCCGQLKDSPTYSRPCRNPQAAATYTSPHWTTLRRRSLAQMLWSSRSVGVSVNRRPPWRRSVAASDPAAGANRPSADQALFPPGCFDESLEASAITA